MLDRSTSSLRGLDDHSSGASLEESLTDVAEVDATLGGKLQAARHGVLVGVLDDGEAVLLGATRDLLADPDADVRDETAFLLQREELQDLGLTVDAGLRKWRQPDGLVNDSLVKEVDRLEFVNIDIDTLGLAFLVESNLVVLCQEVLLEEHVGQVVLALRKHKSLKQFGEAFIVDEVGTDAKLDELAFSIGRDSVDDGL